MTAPRTAQPRQRLQEPDKQQQFGSRVMALFVLAVGLTVLIGAFLIPEGGGYQAVGPRPFPMLIGAAGTLVGAIGVVQAFVGTRRPEDPTAVGEEALSAEVGGPTGPARRRAAFMLLAALIAYALLMPTAGYWQATTVFYAGAARIQGSGKLVRDVLIGLVIGLATYFVFDRLFGIDLPPGYLRLAI